MRLRPVVCLAAVAGLLAALVAGCRDGSLQPPGDGARPVARPARMSPDYTGVCLPHNLAPPNFVVQEAGTGYCLRLTTGANQPLEVLSRNPRLAIPSATWNAALSALTAVKVKALRCEVLVRDAAGQWTRYAPFTLTIGEPVDPYLVYRRIGPVYSLYTDVRIYQRNLTTYEDKPVLVGRQFSRACVNCHTFCNNRPDRITFGVRSTPYQNSALVVTNGQIQKMGATWGYNSWHPTGQAVAYSLNKVRQFFHDAGPEVRDVVDLDSDLMVYRADTGKVETAPAIADPDRLETYPTWSPDGRYLYYCSAPILWTDRETVPPKGYRNVRYDLRRVPYDLATHRFGQPETVLAAATVGGSLLTPRISPDGRWLLFCRTDYGCFPVFQPSSDLYLLDLKSGTWRRLDINSDQADSWHSWSSNGRWIAFSSKRRDGVFTQTYLAHVNDKGEVARPVLVPRRDPASYDELPYTQSVPELVTAPVPVTPAALARAARSTTPVKLELPETSMTRKAAKAPAPSEPWRGSDHR